MNLSGVSSQLSMLPDQILVKEMQTPSGAIPQFLILSELQRRQQMRASQPVQQPSTTVAQDLVAAQARPAQGQGMPVPPMAMPSAAPGMGMMPQPGTAAVPTMGGMRPQMQQMPQAQGLQALRMYKGGVVLPRRSGFNQRGPEGYYTDGGAVSGGGFTDIKDAYYAINSPDPATRAAAAAFINGMVGNAAPQVSDPYSARAQVDIAPPSNMNVQRGEWAPGQGILARAFMPRSRTFSDPSPPSPTMIQPQVPQAQVPQFSVAQSTAPTGTSPLMSSANPVAPQGPGPLYAKYLAQHSAPAQTADPGLPGIDTSAQGMPQSAPAHAPGYQPLNFDDWIAAQQKIHDSGLFDDPTKSDRKAELAQIKEQIAQQGDAAPWQALATAGFKMAQGTSPFFAANAGAGLEGLGSDLAAAKTNQLKEQLELAGMSQKDAEAEATRRINESNVATKFMDAQQRAQELAMNSQNQLQAHEDALANTSAYRQVGLANAAASRENTQAYREQQGQDAMFRNYSTLHNDWVKNNVTAMHINPQTKQPYTESDSPWLPYLQSGGSPVAPAALSPRTIPGLPPPSQRKPGTVYAGHVWTGTGWAPQ